MFSIGVLIAIGYYALWYVFRAFSIEWHTAWNIPGFALLAGSMPWSLPVTSNLGELGEWLGHYGRDVLVVFSVSLGFATNLTLLIFTIIKLAEAIKGKSSRDS